MAMLRSLQAQAYTGDVTFVHVCRAQEDLIFASTLKDLAARWPALRLVLPGSSKGSVCALAGPLTADLADGLVVCALAVRDNSTAPATNDK